MARLFTPSESKYYLMALDAGTGSIRAVIFDLEGNQIAVGQAEWRHLAVPDVPGSMEFDLNKNWQLACECMRQALHNAGIAPEYIAAVSACSMREGIVLYNNEGTPIWACANVDARAAREVSELKELHNNTFENEVYRATGQTLALSAIPRLLWLAHHRSDIYRQASTITMISDWLAYMLSGELAVDPSNAGTTGLLDLTIRDWKPALLDMAGLRADILSLVKETGTLLGVVSSQAAELCGLKVGTPVVVGGGLMRVQLSSSDKMFGFTHATGTEFAGVAQLKDSTFTLERDNTAALTHAMLQSDIENTTSVNVGEQSIGGLAMNGGTLIFDTDIPAATLAEGYISVDTLVVGASDYTWKGRNYQVNGTGDVLIGVPKPWNDPMANNPLTTLNLLEHDDNHVGVQLVKAQTVIGSGGSLTLRDLQGDEVEADKTLHIAQNGTVVAEGDYGFRLTTAPGDGLYVNYGLKALNIHGGQKLTLAEHGGAYGATADMSAKIGGEGDLAINTVRQVSLSNGQNDYQGATYVQMGTLRTDADGALGNTRELNISNAAIVDLNGSTQTVETFTGQMGSTVLFKEGSLTVNKGGISQGELTGGGNLNVTGGTLAVEGLNARYNALTSVSPNAEVSLDNTQGLGRGNIANDGLLTLKNVTGELRNSISGKGIVSATARTDVELDGDNSRFVGQFNIDTGSALSVNEQKNLGDASVINNGLLTISTERSWAMTHSISGSGDLTKLGTGILTLNNDSSAYQGTTDIVGGEIAFGSDSAINTASQHINIHNSGVMSGNVTTAGDVNVMSGGTLRVAKTTIGESAATWRMAARFK
ncbi:FGGY family carbohydrate kinase [Escherichia coli]|uniref:FGGY family carbohydrate kinase n=2 Tax=Escherichia coli TaxID=562 RepID=UPI0002A12644|nr:autoinducer 2 kinase LsrK domain protein [Escherichia coli 90.0091]